jgi:tricorn protease
MGKEIRITSDRDFNEVLGVYDFEFANPKATRVYLVTLRSDLPSPFAPKSDEAGEKKSESPATKKKEQKKLEEAPAGREVPKDFRIDLADIAERVVALPTPAENSRALNAAAHRSGGVCRRRHSPPARDVG